jgi:threonine dehydratase
MNESVTSKAPVPKYSHGDATTIPSSRSKPGPSDLTPQFGDTTHAAEPYIERILRARVYDVAIESPLDTAPRLSRRLGREVWLKREDLQPVFSFKLRGAYNRIAQLDAAQAQRGVICASAGNHAQGVALAARHRGIVATIVMPVTTPRIKLDAVADLGATIVLRGDDFDAACAHAHELATETGATFVHPFDDPDVIAGQGTIAMEILRQRRGDQIAAIFVPVGGGGLIAGIAVYIKALYPNVRVIGVQPHDAGAMAASLAAGERMRLDRVGLFADGVAVREVGAETFRLAQRYVDTVLRVGTDEICAAIQDVFEDTRAIVEPAGALAVAGLKQYAAMHPDEAGALIAINSGANMNFDRLRHVAERADLGAQREALFAVRIPEQPGSFLRFCETIGARNVTEFNYRYADRAQAEIFVGIALSGGAPERAPIRDALAQAGFGVVDISDNELAKLHVRYMVGGKANGIVDERLFRFEFPERPGALLRFLRAIGTRWNISLFHYRNHGSDHGRVLAGIQVPPADAAVFAAHLDALGYARVEESSNDAYRAFL